MRFRATKDMAGNVVVGSADGQNWLIISPKDLYGILKALETMGVFSTAGLSNTMTKLALREGDLQKLGTFTTERQEGTTDG